MFYYSNCKVPTIEFIEELYMRSVGKVAYPLRAGSYYMVSDKYYSKPFYVYDTDGVFEGMVQGNNFKRAYMFEDEFKYTDIMNFVSIINKNEIMDKDEYVTYNEVEVL